MKKKKKFVELDAKYYIEKEPLIITKKIQKIDGKVNLFTLPSISFYVMKIENNFNKYKFSIYNKANFELIQELNYYNYILNKIEIMNENAIILYGKHMEIWTKNQNNLFIKNKTISINITSNILINSKSSLLLYAEPDGILVWQIKENIPQNIITNIKMQYNKTNLFFINNEELLGVHINDDYSYIYFFQMKDFTIVKKMNITEKVGKDFLLESYDKSYIAKINENRIFYIYSKPSKNKTFFLTIKIPGFVIEQQKKNFYSNFTIYKNYIIFYYWNKKIKVFENSKCKFVQEIYNKDFYSMIHLKDNYLLGLMEKYFNAPEKTLVMFRLNLFKE
jgi:hypothetical protein